MKFAVFLFFIFTSMVVQEQVPEFEKHIFVSDQEVLPYRLLRPVEAGKNKKYPLVVFLHGAGERGNDNEANLKYITPLFLQPDNRKKYPAFVLVPQCPSGSWWAPQNWDAPAKAPAHTVMNLIDSLIANGSVDEKRIYLMGLSMGGNGTWYLLTTYPQKFAAGVPICGWGDKARITAMKDVPVWAFHGDADPVVPVERSRELVNALKQVGATPRYTEYPGTGHDSWTPALAEPELLPWLFAHRLKKQQKNRN